jgi:hypothetical protein
MATKHIQKEIEDKAAKTRNAREAAAAPDASDRDKADLKLMEQDLQAARQKSKRSGGAKDTATAPTGGNSKKAMDRKLDAALEDSFPGSDPVSFVQAAPTEKEEDDAENAGSRPRPPDKTPDR